MARRSILIAYTGGTIGMQQTARETMDRVYDAMGLYGPRLLKTYARPARSIDVPALAYC